MWQSWSLLVELCELAVTVTEGEEQMRAYKGWMDGLNILKRTAELKTVFEQVRTQEPEGRPAGKLVAAL